MPLYSFKCTNPECSEFKKELEEQIPLQDFINGKRALCPECKQDMEYLFPAVPKHASWSKWRI